MQGLRAKLDYILKHNHVISKLFRSTASLGVRMLGLFTPMDDKAILFSAHGRKYNDSPKAIYEYILNSHKFDDFKFYWALENLDEHVPGNCVKIKPDTFQYFRIALKCKYWITCVNIERSLKFKRKKGVYLNTWHGIPIKTVGNCAAGRNDYDFSYIDFFCISGDYEIDIYEKSFNVPESHMLKTGMPRNDDLYFTNDDEIEQIKDKLSIPSNKKVILYAPTWRDSEDGGNSYTLKPPIDLSLWEKELSDNYILLFRTHPYTNKLLGIEFNEFVRDYSNYPSINDLMKVSDLLISDYSATIFDYSILEKPIICFAYDYEDYKRNRGLEMNLIEEMPGGLCKTEKEVISRIHSLDHETESDGVRLFKNKYLTYGGQATMKCVDALFNINEVER